MPRYQSKFFAANLPPSWCDTTVDMADMGAPITLTRANGVGALQFSVALYTDGPRPIADIAGLQMFLDEFASRRSLGPSSASTQEAFPRAFVASSFDWAGNFLRVWYIAEGGNVALITYNCSHDTFDPTELAEAEAIVRSLVFGGSDAG